jgi:hypothetical protein
MNEEQLETLRRAGEAAIRMCQEHEAEAKKRAELRKASHTPTS